MINKNFELIAWFVASQHVTRFCNHHFLGEGIFEGGNGNARPNVTLGLCCFFILNINI